MERTQLGVAAAWGLVPAALLLAVSFVEPVFWPRYAILSLPGLCLLVALAADCLWESRRGRAAAAGCLAAIAALAVLAAVRQVHEVQENWRPVAAWPRAARAPGQPTILDNALVLPSLGYYDPAFRAHDDLVVQEWHDEPLPAGFVGFKDRAGYGSVPNGPPSAAAFACLARRGDGTVWMVVAEVDEDLQSDPRDGAAVAWAREHCRVEVRESTARGRCVPLGVRARCRAEHDGRGYDRSAGGAAPSSYTRRQGKESEACSNRSWLAPTAPRQPVRRCARRPTWPARWGRRSRL